MATTVIVKGEFVNNPSGNNIGGARFVHCVATGGTQSVIVKDSGGTTIGTGVTFINFVQSGLTASVASGIATVNLGGKTDEQIQDIVGAMFSGNTETNITVTYQDSDGTIDLEVAGGGKFVDSTSPAAGIHTADSIGINTVGFTTDMVGAGNSFNGMYISNGMTIYDNELNGNHYISTSFNGLMAGPVTINGVLTVDGNYVVV